MQALDLSGIADEIADDELAILDCLQDYHKILTSVAKKTANMPRRMLALNRAQMVKQLMDRLEALETEPN